LEESVVLSKTKTAKLINAGIKDFALMILATPCILKKKGSKIMKLAIYVKAFILN